MTNTLVPLGNYPDVVYRVFTEREHAQQFIDGNIRLGNIYYYKKVEDAKRRDKTEGESHVVHEGVNKHGMFATNSIYILCCHKTLPSVAKCNLGSHVVKINNPKMFAKDLTLAMEQSQDKYFGGIEGCCVEYSKGMESSATFSGYEIVRLAYCQKPLNFSPEEEFRFVAIRKDSAGDFLSIQLNEPMEYCEIINGI